MSRSTACSNAKTNSTSTTQATIPHGHQRQKNWCVSKGHHPYEVTNASIRAIVIQRPKSGSSRKDAPRDNDQTYKFKRGRPHNQRRTCRKLEKTRRLTSHKALRMSSYQPEQRRSSTTVHFGHNMRTMDITLILGRTRRARASEAFVWQRCNMCPTFIAQQRRSPRLSLRLSQSVCRQYCKTRLGDLILA